MVHREGGNSSTEKLLHNQNTFNDLHEKRTSPGQTIYRNDRNAETCRQKTVISYLDSTSQSNCTKIPHPRAAIKRFILHS